MQLTRGRALPTASRETAPVLKRDPSGSTSSYGVGAAGSSVVRWDAAKATSEAYYSNVYVYGAIRAIAQDIGARPFRVGADPTKPQDFNPKHPLAVRLGPAPGGPNPHSSSTQLIKWSVAQKLITGAFAWEINPSDLTFWPLLIRLLKPHCNETGNPAKGYFDYFEYGQAGYGSQNKVRKLTPEQIFYDFTPSQDQWTLPETPLQAARLDISVAVMQDKYDRAFLINDARPATLVVHEAFEDPAQQKAWRRGWMDRFRGAENAGKTLFMEHNANFSGTMPKDSVFVQALGLTQKDMESIKRYEAKIRAICIALGVPLSRLGDASGSTFNNSDIETFNYWTDTVKPTADEMADNINLDLMPLFDSSGNVGWFDYTGIPDLEPKRIIAVTDVPVLYKDGIITKNESRYVAGLPGIGKEGDVFLEPVVNEAPLRLEAPHAPVPGFDPAQVQQIVHSALKPIHDALSDLRAVTPLALPSPRDASIGDEVERKLAARREYRQTHWRTVNRTAERLEKVWHRTFDDLFSDQQRAVLARMEGKRGRQALRRDGEDVDPEALTDAVFDQEFWEAKTEKLATGLYEQTVAASLNQLDAKFGISFDLDAPFAQKFITSRANQLAGRVTQTTYDGIKKALADGAAKGESIPDLAKRIEGLFTQTYANRSTVVARTEVISAYNGSTSTAISNADPEIVGGQEWIATADDRTRDDHLDADGMIVGVDEPFNVGGEDLAYPGDPDGDPANVIQCRCTVAPVVPEDMPPAERSIPRVRVERAAVLLATGKLDLAGAIRTLTKS